VDEGDLPEHVRSQGRYAYRSILIDGEELDFTQGFTDLHTISYQEITAGRGFGLNDAYPSIDLVYNIRNSEVVSPRDRGHTMLSG
jgi:UDP-N-acetyl-2-amino-2-deoxyglucuronate dehydrogenase